MGIFSADIPAYDPPFDAVAYDGAGSGNPASMGGVPVVMPSNDWWKGAIDITGHALDTYKAIAVSRSATGIAVPAGRLSSQPQNPAPGSLGQWFQAMATPGAGAANRTGTGSSPNMLMVAGAVVLLVLVVMMVRR